MKELDAFKNFLKEEESIKEAWSLNSDEIRRTLEELSRESDRIMRIPGLEESNKDLFNFAKTTYIKVERIKRLA